MDTLRTLISDGRPVEKRKQQEEILNLGQAIALQAVELSANDRQAFIKSEVAKFRQIFGPIYQGQELLNNMEEWVPEIVKILAGVDSPNEGDQRE
jgi:hypothetical protein